jgi:hypothetical protein
MDIAEEAAHVYTLLFPLFGLGTLKIDQGETYVDVKPLGLVPVKGVSEPVEVYEIMGAGPVRRRLQATMAARSLSRFVGRDAVVEQLRRALQQAGERHGQLVAVIGEPGVRKSRPLLGVRAQRFFVQRMKTKRGSCNCKARTIRLNTELAKKPAECLEYIIVHELVHLLEATHNARFVALMDRFIPNWLFHRPSSQSPAGSARKVDVLSRS